MQCILTLALLAVAPLASAAAHPIVTDANGLELLMTNHINGNTYWHSAHDNPHASLHPSAHSKRNESSDGSDGGDSIEKRGWLLKHTPCTIGWGECAGDAGCYRCNGCYIAECMTPQVGDCFC